MKSRNKSVCGPLQKKAASELLLLHTSAMTGSVDKRLLLESNYASTKLLHNNLPLKDSQNLKSFVLSFTTVYLVITSF